ncbi:hypothetical protein ACHWQZ_G012936 [Mnemiopsis leidyi]
MANAAPMLGDTRNLTCENKNTNSRRSVPNANLNTTWYGIYSPSPVAESRDRVFTDFAEATVESKKLNARFQKFISEQDARKFAQTGHVESPVRRSRPKLQENVEKSPARKGAASSRGSLGEDHLSTKSCPSVHQRDIVKFRVAIEKGDIQTVMRCAKENPRYLISSIDKPVTVHTGSHYNALHCAAKSGQKEIAEFIINYIISDEPWKILYPNENVSSAGHLERRAMVIDGYFNTSDIGCEETPLHFACKFGHLDFAQWLLTFNQVDITQRNKYDQTAEEVAGTRCAGTEEIQRKVTQLVQDSRHSVYVPVVRAVDNSVPPFLGQPITPEYLHSKRLSSNSSKIMVGELSLDDSLIVSDFETQNLDHSFRKNSFDHNSPLSPSLSICAYAGPMLASGAKEFRKVWKTPPRELSSWRRDTLTGIMRSDSDRGLERVGRDLAVQQKVNWREYWDFLDLFVNLREEEGLNELETYLLKNKSRFISGDAPSKTDQDVLHALPPGGIGQLTERYPNICTWYQQVLTFPEDERKCWTTPVAKRKVTKRDNLTSTPSAQRNNSDVGIVRNLMTDLSLDDEETSPDKLSPADQDIQEILVQGVSNLTVKETNKLFPKTYQQTPDLYGIKMTDTSSPVGPSQFSPVSDETVGYPLSSTPAKSHWLPSSNETRQRYSKPSSSETTVNIDQPRNRVRRYFSQQVLRWLLLFIGVWTLYFAYLYFQADLFLGSDSDRHL